MVDAQKMAVVVDAVTVRKITVAPYPWQVGERWL